MRRQSNYVTSRHRWLCAALSGRLGQGLDREGIKPTPAEARPSHHEHGGLVEHPARRAEQGVVAREELVPAAWRDVAGGCQGIWGLLPVAPVDRARDEVGAPHVEDAPSHLVDDQAGRPHQRADHPGGVAAPGRPREAVPGLGRLEIVRLGPPEAALATVRLGQVGLPVMENFP